MHRSYRAGSPWGGRYGSPELRVQHPRAQTLNGYDDLVCLVTEPIGQQIELAAFLFGSACGEGALWHSRLVIRGCWCVEAAAGRGPGQCRLYWTGLLPGIASGWS
jgi:hypothetical protein